jgi:hypothetical protein
MSTSRAGSILAVDFGSANTRGVLIDLVEGAYRVVAQAEARTTAGFPWGDVGVGLRHVLSQLETITGRNFVGKNGRVITPEQADRSGVDLFLSTASVGRPLRTVLIGLVPTVSVASGLRATSGTYVQVVETLSLDDTRDEETQVNAIVASRPDLIFITGGTEDGARDPVLRMAQVAALALPLMSSQMAPNVLYAGNSALIADIRSLFDGRANLFIAPNIRPSLDDEELESAQVQLAMAFDAASSQRGAGFEQIGAASQLGVMPTAPGYALMTEYLSKTWQGGVLALDIGSGVSVLSASLDSRAATVIRTDLGMGDTLLDLVNAVGASAIQNWIPFPTTDEEIRTYALNKTLRPASVPETVRGLYLEYAFLRAAARALIRDAAPTWDPSLADGLDTTLPAFSHLIAAGATLTRTGRPALTALLMLDALGPGGVTTLLVDPYSVIPGLGALARVNPTAVVQVLDSSGFDRLGVAFNLSGEVKAGKTAMTIKITPQGGTPITRDLDGGRVWVYPLAVGARARVEVRAKGRGLTIGGKTHLKTEVEGGTAGLVFDARGRPLPLAVDVEARAAQIPVWIADATGDAVHSVSAMGQIMDQPPPDTADAREERRRIRRETGPLRASEGRSARPSQPARQKGNDDIDELRDLFS